MNLKAEFIGSFPKVESCLKTTLPEYAFIGRSNVGKSSLINMLLERRQLARISATPGKTQHLNQYKIGSEWIITDLPGYGYAKISKKARERWQRMIQNYLYKRENLILTFVLIDLRIPPQEIDLNFIYELGQNGIPFAIVFTKADKVKSAKQSENRALFEAAMYVHWEELPPIFQTSAKTRVGREELLSYIAELNSASSRG